MGLISLGPAANSLMGLSIYLFRGQSASQTSKGRKPAHAMYQTFRTTYTLRTYKATTGADIQGSHGGEPLGHSFARRQTAALCATQGGPAPLRSMNSQTTSFVHS